LDWWSPVVWLLVLVVLPLLERLVVELKHRSFQGLRA
jgi:hypothetical protein